MHDNTERARKQGGSHAGPLFKLLSDRRNFRTPEKSLDGQIGTRTHVSRLSQRQGRNQLSDPTTLCCPLIKRVLLAAIPGLVYIDKPAGLAALQVYNVNKV